MATVTELFFLSPSQKLPSGWGAFKGVQNRVKYSPDRVSQARNNTRPDPAPRWTNKQLVWSSFLTDNRLTPLDCCSQVSAADKHGNLQCTTSTCHTSFSVFPSVNSAFPFHVFYPSKWTEDSKWNWMEWNRSAVEWHENVCSSSFSCRKVYVNKGLFRRVDGWRVIWKDRRGWMEICAHYPNRRFLISFVSFYNKGIL